MSAFSISKLGQWLLVPIIVTFGFSATASDGIKPIKPNTSSVTQGSQSGAANATSSVGGSATYNSGVDWSRANSVSWKGLNWSAGGTIPQERIPRLSASHLPTSMPSNWSAESSGSQCGYSQYRSKQGYTVNFKCKGYTPHSSCPSGYSRVAESTTVNYIESGCTRNCGGATQTQTTSFCIKR